jgi:hypothetical protein
MRRDREAGPVVIDCTFLDGCQYFTACLARLVFGSAYCTGVLAVSLIVIIIIIIISMAQEKKEKDDHNHVTTGKLAHAYWLGWKTSMSSRYKTLECFLLVLLLADCGTRWIYQIPPLTVGWLLLLLLLGLPLFFFTVSCTE